MDIFVKDAAGAAKSYMWLEERKMASFRGLNGWRVWTNGSQSVFPYHLLTIQHCSSMPGIRMLVAGNRPRFPGS